MLPRSAGGMQLAVEGQGICGTGGIDAAPGLPVK